MVLKNKRPRDRVKTSGLANKQKKMSYKGKKKENYKKSIPKTEECNICFSSVTICMDNKISCGKTSHTICGDCKVRMKNDNCPMCRSHPVKQPIARDMYLNIHKKVKKPKSQLDKLHVNVYDMSPKQLRGYHRTGPYFEPFGKNTNRLIRQRKIAHASGALPRYPRVDSDRDRDRDRDSDSDSDWFTEEQVLRYNGSLRTDYDSSSSSSSGSSSGSSSSNSDLILSDDLSVSSFSSLSIDSDDENVYDSIDGYESDTIIQNTEIERAMLEAGFIHIDTWDNS
mgnify:CR=1 FL=1